MKTLAAIVLAGVIYFAPSIAIADTPTAPTPNAAQQAPIKYPYTFHCKHCGMSITVHNAAEWNKDCEACACGSKNIECSPTKIDPDAKPAAVDAKPAAASSDAPTATAPAKPAGATAAPIKYPYTFHCSHCGMLITVNSEADWKKDCDACACGMKKIDCKPKDGK